MVHRLEGGRVGGRTPLVVSRIVQSVIRRRLKGFKRRLHRGSMGRERSCLKHAILALRRTTRRFHIDCKAVGLLVGRSKVPRLGVGDQELVMLRRTRRFL